MKDTEPQRCKHPRCKCLLGDGKEYCSSDCEKKSERTGHCPCTHDGCYLECDLVMKGGVTSGIVYPPLVYKLYENNYRFRNIGGTSAGAIMAAMTAAAEYGREERGFEKLNDVKEQLGKPGFLLNLFQPSEETRPLYNFLLGAVRVSKGADQSLKRQGKLGEFCQLAGKSLRASRLSFLPKGWETFKKIWRLAGKLQRPSPALFLAMLLIGLAAGLGIAAVLILVTGGNFKNNGSAAVLSLFAAFGAIVGYVVAFGRAGYRLVKILTSKIPENHFGMCTGLENKSTPEDQKALTRWMNESINYVAGISDSRKPLTFGMLKKKRAGKPQEDGINLRMMTSNLSQNQPYVLPFTQQFLIYKEDEFREFFPEEIVEYMKTVAPEKPSYDLSRIPGYFFLPAANDLPILVATRLSLSFPLLLCALPLYTIVADKIAQTDEIVQLEESDLQLNWFSDGGIASNFPIQFFDSWLPTRPSFGVNLTSLPEEGFSYENTDSEAEEEDGLWKKMFVVPGEKKFVRSKFSSPTVDTTCKTDNVVTGKAGAKKAGTDKEDIYLPAADEQPFTEWIPMTKRDPNSDEEERSLFKFIWAIFTTAQNYRDNMQAMLPSYRERIVQIRLSEEEGGLNLAMPDKTIQKVMEKGEKAGRILLENFDFKVHQWVRFQVLMIQMEKYLLKALEVAGEDPETKRRLFDYEELMKVQKENGYPWSQIPEWCEHADKRMKAMGMLIKEWEEFQLGAKPPLPESALRVMPEI